ncbi:MAG TPA: acyl-CoA dehydrogenase family protein [Rhizomicrobium sp.]|jgi:alkylation response protein AidB-like acyl-CoA dehydrogenase
MSEFRTLVLATAERVFTACTGEREADHALIAEAGLFGLLVPEGKDGFGGSWEDAGALARLAGRHAVEYPVMDTILQTCLASSDQAWSDDRVFNVSAALRAAPMAGALEATLLLSVTYARERHQFGKPLASFQAIQQQLAVLAEEAAAANMAAAAAFRALDRGEAAFECAAAKLRVNRAVKLGAGIAHQVHGAMGFTAEYALQRLTRLLWVWQSEFGNERYWADRIGRGVAARGPANFWADLTAQADRNTV